MNKHSPSQRILIAELILICSTTLLTYLLHSASNIQQYLLGVVFQFVLAVVDVAIFLAVVILYRFEGGLAVYYVGRVIGVVLGDGYSVGQCLAVAVGIYGAVKGFSLVGQKYLFLKLKKRNNFQQKLAKQTFQQNRRNVVIAALILSINTALSYQLSFTYSLTPSIIFLINLSFFIFQIHLLTKSQQLIFKMLSNTIHYNIILYICQTLIFSRYIQGVWFAYTVPSFIFLSFNLILMRVYIGSKSNKFNNFDSQLFDLVCPFTGDQSHRSFRYLKTIDDKILKIIDRCCQNLSLFLYFIGFFAAIHLKCFILFPIGTFFVISYPIQNNQSWQFLINLKQKLSIYFPINLKIILPLILLLYLIIFTHQPTQQQILYNQFNQCNTSHRYQLTSAVGLIAATFMSLGFSVKNRYKIHEWVKYLVPVFIFMSLYWIECQSINMIMMEFYTIAFCFEIIRQTSISFRKGSKRE